MTSLHWRWETSSIASRCFDALNAMQQRSSVCGCGVAGIFRGHVASRQAGKRGTRCIIFAKALANEIPNGSVYLMNI